MANDADSFAISEATAGAGAGYRSVFGVILGTGVGGGFCWNGTLLDGPNAIAGEWGHNPLPWSEDHERPGRSCYCGWHGCLETLLSGPGFAEDFKQETGLTYTPQEIFARAEQGFDDAGTALCRYEHRLARGLASVINILDPHIIVLGGGLSNLKRLYENVPRMWGRGSFRIEWIRALFQPCTGIPVANVGLLGSGRWTETPVPSHGLGRRSANQRDASRLWRLLSFVDS